MKNGQLVVTTMIMHLTSVL